MTAVVMMMNMVFTMAMLMRWWWWLFWPCVVGSSPLAMMPSHSWMIFGIMIIVLLWYLSYDNRIRKLNMCEINWSEFLDETFHKMADSRFPIPPSNPRSSVFQKSFSTCFSCTSWQNVKMMMNQIRWAEIKRNCSSKNTDAGIVWNLRLQMASSVLIMSWRWCFPGNSGLMGDINETNETVSG